MIVVEWIRRLISLYALLLVVHFALPYLAASQRPWMAVLARICEPGVRVGNRVAAKVLPNRRFKGDMGAQCAIVLCVILRFLLALLFLF